MITRIVLKILAAICIGIITVEDARTKEISTWIAVLGILFGVTGMAGVLNLHAFMEFMVFVTLQLLLFSRFYGFGDCLAFILCAAQLSLCGAGMLQYLLHMLWAFLLLAFVQGIRRNINRKGNLKEPVALIPYITVTFIIQYLIYPGGNYGFC